jgi:hypothetical protein
VAQPLTPGQVLAIYQRYGTGRLDGFTAAVRAVECLLGITGDAP